MANGLLDRFQPQTIGYGNTLLEDPAQYDLSGFQAIGQTVGDMAKGVLQSAKLPGRALRGEMGPPSLLNPEFVEGATQFGLDFGMLPALGTAAIASQSPDVLRMGFGGYHGSPHNFPPAVRVRDKETGNVYVQEKDDPVLLGMMDMYPDRYEIMGENPLGMFDISKVGTGEGAQAYGVGHYLSGSKGIAGYYRDTIKGNDMPFSWNRVGDTDISKPLEQLQKTDLTAKNLAINFAHGRQNINEYLDVVNDKNVKSIIDKLKDMDVTQAPYREYEALMKSDPDSYLAATKYRSTQNAIERFKANDIDLEQLNKDNRGKMYEVNVAADPSKLMDFDKPISAQPENVKAAINDALDTLTTDDAINLGFDPFDFGGDAKMAIEEAKKSLMRDDNTVLNLLNTMRDVRGSHGVMEKLLAQKGVAGLKYTADGYRHLNVDDPDAVKNYVIFDESLMDIVKKYGLLPVAGTGAAYGLLSDERQMTGDEMLRAGII